MVDLPAYCFHRVFEPEPLKAFEVDRHYLLYSAKGSLRLETEDRSWMLPPSRAAWIAANVPIKIEIKHPVTCCSVLFDTNFIEAPDPACEVFDMTPMAREMVLECREWGLEAELDEYAVQLFRTLAMTCRKLSNTPCDTWVPLGESQQLKNALLATQDRLADSVEFAEIARAAHLSERSLARRFADETGMTWRQMQRRMRMIRAMELLAGDDQQVTTIALDVGYNSLSAFNAAFREFTGQSPTEYRKQP